MKTTRLLLVTCFLILLSGFQHNDGRDMGIPYNPQTGNTIDGIVRTGIMVGPISNFGSIIINGVNYSTNQAAFSLNGAPGIEADLDVGQTVTVRGSISDSLLNGNAVEVIYNDNVTGPVESVDVQSGTFVVLGQTVSVDSSTSFDESIPDESIEGLQVGSLIEVTGLVNANGSIAATRAKAVPVGGQFEILSTVTNLNNVDQTFMLNAANVSFSNASIEGFPNGQLQNGQLVEAQGIALDGNGVLEATRIIRQTKAITGHPNDWVELQGFITQLSSQTDFAVGTNRVKVNAKTQYIDGNFDDILPDTRLEVEGSINAGGTIVASKIKFYQPPVIRLEAPISSIDVSGGVLELLGISIEVTVETRLEDKSDLHLAQLTLQQLNLGDYVEIRGTERFEAPYQVRAVLVERDDADERITLQGYPQSVTEQSVQILGVNCDTSNAEFYSVLGDSITAQEFFNQADEFSLVKVRGTQIGLTNIRASKVEFESLH